MAGTLVAFTAFAMTTEARLAPHALVDGCYIQSDPDQNKDVFWVGTQGNEVFRLNPGDSIRLEVWNTFEIWIRGNVDNLQVNVIGS